MGNDSRTAGYSNCSIGAYIELQSAILRQLPRPGGQLSQTRVDTLLANQGAVKRALEGILLPKLLLLHDAVCASAYTLEHPREFFMSDRGKGRHVYRGVQKLVEEATGSPGRCLEMQSRVLLDGAYDHQIIGSLPEGHSAFKNTVNFWSCLAWLIDDRDQGMGSDLLVNGLPNLFYLRSRGGVVTGVVVRKIIRWTTRSWRIRTFPLDAGCAWSAGALIFTPSPRAVRAGG